MYRYRLLTGMIAVFFVIGVLMIDCAMAGELVKAHATSVSTKFEKIDVGDEDGHVIAIVESKQIWIDDKTGEKTFGTSSYVMDMNMKTGKAALNGYSVRSYPNGEKWFSKSEGVAVGPGLMKGTFTYTGGTGKYEGLHGEGTWEAQSMGPGVSYMTAEGVREYGK